MNHMQLLKVIQEDDPDDFKDYLRMDENTFNFLLSLVKGALTKKDTVMRKAIPPEERLIATLRYLATGRYYNCLRFSAGISDQALGYIIPETCRVLYEEIRKEYMKFLRNKKEWRDVADEFSNHWQFINYCGGALDGKHIRIARPPHSGATYYNYYKGFYSIVLMALLKADYKFIWLYIGQQGRISDGGIFERTSLCNDLKSNKLNFPPKIENDMGLEYVIIGDEAFMLDKHLLKPYSVKDLTHERRIYNYRLSRARNVVENAFGLLSSRFRVFHTTIPVNVESVKFIVAAACVLHNFLLTESPSYVTQSTFDRLNKKTWTIDKGDWRKDNNSYKQLTALQPSCAKNVSTCAKKTRDEYCEFFNASRKVEWQETMIAKGKA